MGKFKEELAHHIKYCEIFSHHIMFICALTAWVRGPLILFTFILKRCHAFIISVIVVIRRSPIIFIDHFLWHFTTVNHSKTHFHLCPTGSQHAMSKWAYFHMYVWAMILTPLSYWFIIGREAGSNVSYVATFWVLSLAFWIKVFGDGHRWLFASLLLYNMHVSCSNLQ